MIGKADKFDTLKQDAQMSMVVIPSVWKPQTDKERAVFELDFTGEAGGGGRYPSGLLVRSRRMLRAQRRGAHIVVPPDACLEFLREEAEDRTVTRDRRREATIPAVIRSRR